MILSDLEWPIQPPSLDLEPTISYLPMTVKRRYFIALLPPSPIQAEVTAVKEYISRTFESRAALRSPPHITLQAPFEWLESDIDQVRTCLAHFASGLIPFTVSLSGFGAFVPRVIYIQVESTADLTHLQTHLATCLKESLAIVDAKAATRKFTPHMTVAFRDLSRQKFKAAWPDFQDRPFESTFIATDLTLLIHTGQRWVIDQIFPFNKI